MTRRKTHGGSLNSARNYVINPSGTKDEQRKKLNDGLIELFVTHLERQEKDLSVNRDLVDTIIQYMESIYNLDHPGIRGQSLRHGTIKTERKGINNRKVYTTSNFKSMIAGIHGKKSEVKQIIEGFKKALHQLKNNLASTKSRASTSRAR